MGNGRTKVWGVFAPGSTLRALTAALLVLAFAFIALPAEMHRHAGPSVAAGSAHGDDCSPSAAVTTHSAARAFSPADCDLCEFAAALVSPAVEVVPPAAVPHFEGARASSLPLRAQPYRPYRFADRSSSRAPPAAVLASA